MTISLKPLDEFETDAADMFAVGKKIRSARQSVGYSIEDLAVTCGLASSEITAIEEGVDADLGRLKRIASALQLSISDLLEGQE